MIRVGGRITGVSETVSALSTLPSILRQAGQAAMRESLELLSEIVRKEHMEGPYPEEIQSRSGSFRATFRRGHAENIFRVESTGTTILGTFGSEDKRARILNDGGVIRPKTSQYLAVRSEFTRTSGGVVRAKYQQPLRNIPNTFVRPIRAPRAKAAVFEKIGRRIVLIAWLVLYVVIRGRKFMAKTEAKAAPQIPAIFQRRFDEVLQRLQDTLARFRG